MQEQISFFDYQKLNNSNKIILDLCGGTGSWSKPYAEAGYDVRIITLPNYDVTTYVPPDEVYGILAAPPCTEFSPCNAIAAARERNPEEGMIVVNACLEIIRSTKHKFWAMENPSGLLKRYLGKPKLVFQPWEYGDAWTKRTDIWGDFNIPRKRFDNWDDVPRLPIYCRKTREKPSLAFLHKSAQSLIPQFAGFVVNTDADLRAITPPGFAKSFFEVNR